MPYSHLFPTGLPGPAYGFAPAPIPTWVTIGPAVLPPAGDYVFEAYMRATTGKVYARLIDDFLVPSGEVQTDLTTFARYDSDVLTLDGLREYRTQVGKVAPDAGELLGSRLKPA